MQSGVQQAKGPHGSAPRASGTHRAQAVAAAVAVNAILLANGGAGAHVDLHVSQWQCTVSGRQSNKTLIQGPPHT